MSRQLVKETLEKQGFVGSHCAQLTLKEWAVLLGLLEGEESASIIWNSPERDICFIPFIYYLYKR